MLELGGCRGGALLVWVLALWVAGTTTVVTGGVAAAESRGAGGRAGNCEAAGTGRETHEAKGR